MEHGFRLAAESGGTVLTLGASPTLPSVATLGKPGRTLAEANRQELLIRRASEPAQRIRLDPDRAWPVAVADAAAAAQLPRVVVLGLAGHERAEAPAALRLFDPAVMLMEHAADPLPTNVLDALLVAIALTGRLMLSRRETAFELVPIFEAEQALGRDTVLCTTEAWAAMAPAARAAS
jgi:hypothetical protein